MVFTLPLEEVRLGSGRSRRLRRSRVVPISCESPRSPPCGRASPPRYGIEESLRRERARDTTLEHSLERVGAKLAAIYPEFVGE